MTEPRFDYKNSRWTQNEQAQRWGEELDRLSPDVVRERLRQRYLSGSPGDIRFGDVSIPSDFVEDWLSWNDQQSRQETVALATKANDLAQEANSLVKTTNIIATLALIVAIVAIAISIIALFLKR
jgi:hypothetical protein